ncbi:hypothetical protein LCGC14_1041030 [marine sediment metagenome]|uniref:Uncharacterized protein n=1 Tax=marine sediment metagenome TaxID=412755 RepID=A0A0F9NDE2_9ZZZZ
MATYKELNEKYGTGVQHTLPASLHSSDGKLHPSYRCKAHLGDILREYMDHLSMPPTDRCKQIPPAYDGVIRTDISDITEEELEWASVEYIIRESLNKFLAGIYVGKDYFIKFTITVKEN